ncbi:MAG: PilZ domain-containing protein [Pseudomonadota bacterium]
MTEQRNNERVPSNLKLKVKEYIKGKMLSYRTHDVSSSGVFLRTRSPRLVGETLLLHYPVPGSRDVVRVEGEVVRVVDKHAVRANPKLERGMGIAFVRAIDPQPAVR